MTTATGRPIVVGVDGATYTRSALDWALEEAVREAAGADATVLLDSGIRHGQDIIAALAHGADAVMIGRAYLYGLMAGGEAGVERAVEILRAEYRRGLQLLGLDATSKIAPRHVAHRASSPESTPIP